jgi:hypothetical protein
VVIDGNQTTFGSDSNVQKFFENSNHTNPFFQAEFFAPASQQDSHRINGITACPT